MTEVLPFLQRAKQKGECLLAPRAMEKPDLNSLLASPPKKRTGRFFLRENRREESKENERRDEKRTEELVEAKKAVIEFSFPKDNERRDEKPTEELVKTKKAVTAFSFPDAPQEFAEEEDPLAPVVVTGKEALKTEKTQTSEKHGSEEERSEKDGSKEDSSENEQENRAPVKPDSPQPKEHDNPCSSTTKEKSPDVMQDKRPKMEGYGNSQPQDDAPVAAVGRLFRHLRRTGEMKSMKIATDATKDERTIGETVTHCFQVAIAPEIYAEHMEGEGNLGFYTPIRPIPATTLNAPSPFSGAEYHIQNAIKWKTESTKLRLHVKELLAHIDKIELDLKNKDLEATLWKFRAEELQNELRQGRDKDNDDDSSPDSESEIDHEWKEDGLVAAKEESLVDTDIAPPKPAETIEFDPLSVKAKDVPAQSNDDKDEVYATIKDAM